MTIKSIMHSVVMLALFTVINAQAADLYYSDSGPGYYPWNNVDGWIIYNSGGTHYDHLPTTNDNVMINATTPKAENGNALSITNNVFAECNYFASGHQNYNGTAWLRLDGGSLTCQTSFVTGEGYPGLTTLESGNLYGGGTFYVGSMSGGYGTVSNNGATVNFNSFVLANYTAALPSTLVQTNGSMISRGAWNIGYRGEALAEINGGTVSSAGNFYLGNLSGGNGTLILNDGSVYSAGAFFAGYESGSSGTLILNGGSITVNSYAMIGRYGDGLAEMNTGTLHCTGNLYIGDYSGSSGVVTNNGTQISTDADMRLGYEAGSFGRLVHNSGTLDIDDYLYIGRNGGIGEFEVDSTFNANIMIIGSGFAPTIPGTGTVSVTENAVGTIDNYLRINNGDLYMRGGNIHLQNVGNPNQVNLFVRTGEDRRGKIQGWGTFTNVNETITLRMENNGQIIADGEGVERDLNLNQIAVVYNEITNSVSGTNGWYAINKGRVMYPRTWQTFTPGNTYCWGDYYQKTVPQQVNSVAFSPTVTFNAAIRGCLYAADRSDIPTGLPQENMRPIGIWRIGAFTGKLTMDTQSFDALSLTFRYDHTRIINKDIKLRLYHYNGSSWTKVGSCAVGGDTLISTDTPIAPVPSDDYNVGWFAVMAVELNGTVIMVK